MEPQFSTPGFLWPLLSLVCLLFLFRGLYAALLRTNCPKSRGILVFLATLFITALWITVLIRLTGRDFFSDFHTIPPRPALAFLVPLPFILLFTFSSTGESLLRAIPGQWLINMQAFRLFVELLLWFAFLSRKLPVQMSFEGGNFDFITGLLALPVGYFCFIKKRWPIKMAIAFNILGLLLLVNILIIAILSMPGSLRVFYNEPSGYLIAKIPFILLPGILVPIAYSLHIFSLRQLILQKKYSRNTVPQTSIISTI